MGLKRHVRLFLPLALVLAFGYGCVQKTATEIELPEGKTAKIVFIVGDVFFRPVSDSEWIRATVGDIIAEGTSIRTFQDS